jgi:hypothetical protein
MKRHYVGFVFVGDILDEIKYFESQVSLMYSLSLIPKYTLESPMLWGSTISFLMLVCQGLRIIVQPEVVA